MLASNATPTECMPAIMDLDLLPDMGRMTGQLQSAARTYLFADAGGRRAAAVYTLIGTAKLKDVDPQAWIADVLRPIADHPASRLRNLLPWHWEETGDQAAAA